ncbi:MAG: tRNA uridine-5-carboxymethylaminomethyl(34) synthesis GTPase MnmE [Bacteroidia bacterium]|nr:tRNA uridine-5-carboxymethylaminomethyl(34) synthesis GTPase MnmE [Sphingobacteriaceae bacterium]MBP9068971.1 tRNA uridine-5-carboxymethylaminomethyl(34) synthesis GTPase MnmE [Bacteroidia bacterium]
MIRKDTIIALATPQGVGAIGVIRISGADCISLVERFFWTKNLKLKKLSDKPSHTLHFGIIAHLDVVIDEVVVSLYKAPHSYTGEESVEISCHGSPFILQQVLALFLKNGCRMAEPGEFTMRAFLNGKLDLSQAEAVADLIASNSAVSHQVAMQQMRGGFSSKIKLLRDHLLNFASLIELELDFSEEDVEFADRSDLKKLIFQISNIILKLLESFEVGNVIKNGIPVAIVGKPNAGKSTLLNLLLDDDKAIVSEIPGTTRDVIEDEMVIDGVLFRFIDTAGIRTTTDIIEQMGVNKAFEVIKKSAIVIYLFDSHELSSGDLQLEVDLIKQHINGSKLVLVANKIDVEGEEALRKEYAGFKSLLYISAKEGKNINELRNKLVALFDAKAVSATDTIVTNARHAESLRKALDALNKVTEGLNAKVPGDLLALDIRYALDELGAITGQVTNDDLLGNIFSKFCIGK